MLWRIKFPEVGLTRRQVAGNLGVGPATLNTRIRVHHYIDMMPNVERELAQEPTASTREPDSQGFEADRKTDQGRVFPAHRSSETDVDQKRSRRNYFPTTATQFFVSQKP